MAVKYYSRRRRALYAQGESFSSLEIFERDSWVCGICRGPVNSERRYPDWECATIDHILPLSLGGQHTRDNVQCAHRMCNELKGDSYP